MDLHVLPDYLRGSYEGSFARKTITERLPVILTKVIDLLCREKENIAHRTNDPDDMEEIKSVCSQLSEMKSSMQRNKRLTPLEGPAHDISAWNRALVEAGGPHHSPVLWFSAPWLLIECYMYRKIRQFVECTCVLAEYDYFREQKMEALETSWHVARGLAEQLLLLVSPPPPASSPPASSPAASSPPASSPPTLDKQQFTHFLQACLWANRNDLSHRPDGTGSDCFLSPSSIDELQSYILANDTEPLFEIISQLKPNALSERRLDIIMDNAGLEMMADLCLADLLTACGLVDKVVFHVKSIPWYVSDVTPADFDVFLARLCCGDGNDEPLKRVGERWRQRLGPGGQWHVETHVFWTSPHPFCRMNSVAADLYSELNSCSLLLIKGDLNYRKLLSDRAWRPTTLLADAVSGFRPCCWTALRTLKSDIVCGLNPDQTERAAAADSDWMVSGKWAVVQLMR